MNNELSKDDVYNLSDEEFHKVISQMNTIEDTPKNRILDNSTSNSDSSNLDSTLRDDESEVGLESKIQNDDSNDDSSSIGDKESEKEIKTDTNEQKPKEDENKNNQTPIYTIKANNETFNLTLDDLIQLAPKALNYTAKLQKIAPYRRAISALEEKGITEEELNQLIEIREGNSLAIKNLLDKHNIPTTDITSIENEQSQKYKPQEYGKDVSDLEWEEVVNTIKANPNYEKMRVYVNTFDEESQKLLRENPQSFDSFFRDIEANVFDEAANEAKKKKLMELGAKQPDIIYYIQAAQSIWDKRKKEIEEKTKPKTKPLSNSNANKSNAKLSGDKSSSPKNKKVIEMITDIDDEEYQEFLKRVRQQY